MVGPVVLVLSGLAVLGSLFWYAQLFEGLRYRRQAIWLRDLPDEPPEGEWPALALIFAARNEAGMVEQATRSMLAQDYPALEVIAVDDRSTDATGSILDAIAAEDARLRMVHIRELPSGWLGKTHAVQAAADSAQASWLLFTDADVIFAPGTLRRAVALAVRSKLDHLAVAPDILTESTGERTFLAMFFLLMNAYAPPRKVGNPRHKAAVGVGAFNLVRADAFRAIGGFRRLTLSVDEDMRLGQALKFAGYRGGVALGKEMVLVRWQVGLGGMVRGLEKNFFAGAEYRLSHVAFAVFVFFTIGVAPYLGLFVGLWWTRVIAAGSIAAIAIILRGLQRQGGVEWYHALVLPVGALACIVALIRSAALAVRRRGIRWRDHHYPLDELRAHVRMRNAWSREVWKSTR